FGGHGDQLAADSLTTPGCTDVGGGDQAALFVHLGDEGGHLGHLGGVEGGGGQVVRDEGAAVGEDKGGEASPVGAHAEAGVVSGLSNLVSSGAHVFPGPVFGGRFHAGILKGLRQVDQAQGTPVFRQGID